MDIVVNINVEGQKPPEVKVNKAPLKRKPVMKQTKRFGGVLQFPAPQSSSSVLDMIGIKET